MPCTRDTAIDRYGYLEDVVFRRTRLVNNLNGGFSMGLYGLVGEPGAAAGVSVAVEGMEITGSLGNRTGCPGASNGTRRVCSYGNFDIVLDQSSRIFTSTSTPHAPCATLGSTLGFVPMLIGC